MVEGVCILLRGKRRDEGGGGGSGWVVLGERVGGFVVFGVWGGGIMGGCWVFWWVGWGWEVFGGGVWGLGGGGGGGIFCSLQKPRRSAMSRGILNQPWRRGIRRGGGRRPGSRSGTSSPWSRPTSTDGSRTKARRGERWGDVRSGRKAERLDPE